MNTKQFNTALLMAHGLSENVATIVMGEVDGLLAENARLKAALETAETEVKRLQALHSTSLSASDASTTDCEGGVLDKALNPKPTDTHQPAPPLRRLNDTTER